MTKRQWILLGSALPVLALLALLAWGSIKLGSGPGSLGVNDEFGEVEVNREQIPDFAMELLGGGSLETAHLRGKLVLVDFWASWCPPCRHEAPDLAQVYNEYRDRPVEFVGVNIWDNEEAAANYLDEFQVPYPNGIDREGSIAIEYGVRGIPEKFFIGGDGRVLRKFVGPITGQDLRQVLDDLLLQEGLYPGN